MKKIFYLLIMILSQGCIDTVTGASTFRDEDSLNRLSRECRELDAEPSFLEAFQRIKKNTDKIFQLLGEKTPSENLAEIKKLGQIVHEDSATVERLAGGHFTDPKYDQGLYWRIAERKLKSNLPEFGDCKFKVERIDVLKSFYMGQENADLGKAVSWKLVADPENYGRKVLVIGINRRTSSLDLCQLQKTMGMVIRVHTVCDKDKASEDFNLITKGVDHLWKKSL